MGKKDNRKKDIASVHYKKARIDHWDNVARRMETWRGYGGYYHRRLEEIFQFLTPLGDIGSSRFAALREIFLPP